MQPYPVAGEWSAAAAAGVGAGAPDAEPGQAGEGGRKEARPGRIELALPGDEEHHELPGELGARHRVLWDRATSTYAIVREGVSFPQLLMAQSKL